MRKTLLVLLFSVSLAFAQLQIGAQSTAAQENVSRSRAEPLVTTQPQPGSPLSISTKTYWFDAKIFEIYVVVKNVSDKAIRAYTTIGLEVPASEPGKGCLLYNFPSPGKILIPGQTDGKSTWRRAEDENAQPQLEFAVDFVEFADGSTWGQDSCQSGERLDGIRAGVRAARVQFKRTVAEKGPERLMAELKEGSASVDVPIGHSSLWVESFRVGIETIRSRVSRAYEEGGLPEIIIALQQPIDASESPEAGE